jgi:hypothetical protein
VEVDIVDLASPPERVWQAVRQEDLPQSAIVRGLFAIRTMVTRATAEDWSPPAIRIEKMTSSEARPGFQILADDPPREVAVGAIGKVWRLDIPFVHVAGADEYARFAEEGFIKVAWTIRVVPLGDRHTRIALQLRVAGTDESSWQFFRRYFRLIGPGSRFIRRSLLRALARRFGRPSRERVIGDNADRLEVSGVVILPRRDTAGGMKSTSPAQVRSQTTACRPSTQ